MNISAVKNINKNVKQKEKSANLLASVRNRNGNAISAKTTPATCVRTLAFSVVGSCLYIELK